jgi:hypothetical protein
MTREEAQEIWNVAWDAALETERQRAQLESDEGFACVPREWCFDLWCSRNGLPPAPRVLVPTTEGFIEKHWNPEKGSYEDPTGSS